MSDFLSFLSYLFSIYLSTFLFIYCLLRSRVLYFLNISHEHISVIQRKKTMKFIFKEGRKGHMLETF